MQELLTVMHELTQAPGVPGNEHAVRQVMQRHLEPLGTCESDNLGGIVCRKEGQADGPKILLTGHMDEVGFMVTHIQENGFLKFQTLGGWMDQVLLSHRVEVITRQGPIVGVIGSKPPHLMKEDERNRMVKAEDMTIDIGASSQAEATEWGVRPGDPIVPVSPLTTMHNEKLMLTKAWDNRVGCALVIEILRQLQHTPHPNIVYGAGTVQEEVGLRGAEIMARLVDPDIGFALEGNPATDTPGIPAEQATAALNKGPVISIYDRTMIAHTGLRNLVAETAEAEEIPVQHRFSRGGTDAGKIHLHGKGVPTSVISIPTRYIHSPNSILHLDDVARAAHLLVAVIKRLDSATVRHLTA